MKYSPLGGADALPIIVHVFDYAIHNLINSNKRIYKLGKK